MALIFPSSYKIIGLIKLRNSNIQPEKEKWPGAS